MDDTSKQAKHIGEALAAGQRVTNLAERVLALQTADKLTLASVLLLAGKVDLAESIATRAVHEIQLRRLFGKTKADQFTG